MLRNFGSFEVNFGPKIWFHLPFSLITKSILNKRPTKNSKTAAFLEFAMNGQSPNDWTIKHIMRYATRINTGPFIILDLHRMQSLLICRRYMPSFPL